MGEQIRESLILGIDLGIGSCGWALIDEARTDRRIVGLGVRTFDVPETARDLHPKKSPRGKFQ